MDDLLPFDDIRHFSFSPRPIPLPAELRPMLRIGQIMLIIKTNCRAGKASSLQIHLLCWALSSSQNMNAIHQAIASTDEYRNALTISIDPSVNRVLRLAIADELLRVDESGKFALAPKGEIFFASIMHDEVLLRTDKTFLRSLGKKISDAAAHRLVEGKR